MKVFETRLALQTALNTTENIGFVPTMGALHQGHVSLIAEARKNHQTVVASIFVNPTQFNNPEDFKKYPIDTEKDLEKLRDAGCDMVFLPSVAEIYPQGTESNKRYDLQGLEAVMEGKMRPGHFQGVARVVHLLLDVVKPKKLYLGEKDFQQICVIKTMVETEKIGTELVVCKTIREISGLAMSSRNRRLDEFSLSLAKNLYAALQYVKQEQKNAHLAELLRHAEMFFLKNNGIETEYLQVCLENDLTKIVDKLDGHQKYRIFVAASIAGVRLIDNIALYDEK